MMMWELDKKSSRQRNDAASAGSSGMGPGKSTLTSQLPYVQATSAPNRDIDRPAANDAAKVPSPVSSLPRLDLGKSATPSPPGDAAPLPVAKTTRVRAWTRTRRQSRSRIDHEDRYPAVARRRNRQ